MHFDMDLHVHTHHSPCGDDEMVPREIIRLAVGRGIRKLAFTDHLYPFTEMRTIEDVRAKALECPEVKRGEIDVLFGCEAEVMSPGRTAGSQEIADNLDFVMAGATHFQNKGMTDMPPTNDLHEIGGHYLRMFEYAVSLPWVSVVAHPFFVTPGTCPIKAVYSIRDEELLPAIELAKQNDVAIEISRRVFWPGQLDFSTRFYRLCKRVGTKFTVGSDAHQLDHVGNIRVLQPLIEDLGLSESDFWQPRNGAR